MDNQNLNPAKSFESYENNRMVSQNKMEAKNMFDDVEERLQETRKSFCDKSNDVNALIDQIGGLLNEIIPLEEPIHPGHPEKSDKEHETAFGKIHHGITHINIDIDEMNLTIEKLKCIQEGLQRILGRNE